MIQLPIFLPPQFLQHFNSKSYHIPTSIHILPQARDPTVSHMKTVLPEFFGSVDHTVCYEALLQKVPLRPEPWLQCVPAFTVSQGVITTPEAHSA